MPNPEIENQYLEQLIESANSDDAKCLCDLIKEDKVAAQTTQGLRNKITPQWKINLRNQLLDV
jgi:hypothetical protein